MVTNFGVYSNEVISLVKLVTSFSEDHNCFVSRSVFGKNFVSEVSNALQYGKFLVTINIIERSRPCHPTAKHLPSKLRYQRFVVCKAQVQM